MSRLAPGTVVAARRLYPDSDTGPGQGTVLDPQDLVALHYTPSTDPEQLRGMSPVRMDGEEVCWLPTDALQPYAEALRDWEHECSQTDMAVLAAPLQERDR